MDIVALVSGGKDSCYSILKAQAHGHKVVVLGHIVPPCEEADSLMYQSVGSSAVSLLAEALDLPLIIRTTHAKAKTTTLTYTATKGDEVEDLVSLLQDIKLQFPTVQGVCSGALWSDYQRLRVENAACRTGLFSVAPLWRREQSELLDEMIENGVDAVLIKVAGIGLDKSHLGKSLHDMRPVLHKLEKMYGSHVCGEGGEYETLVRWMPGFKKRLEFLDTEIVSHSDDFVAPVYYLRLNKLCLTKPSVEKNQKTQEIAYYTSPLFLFQPRSYVLTEDRASDHRTSPFSVAEKESVGTCSNYIFISVQSSRDGSEGIYDCCIRLKHFLVSMNENLCGVINVQLHLQDVCGSSYKGANKVYGEVFGASEIVLPPARACVGVTEGNVGTFLEALVRRGKRDCAVSLHVQSLSEWAPPCIGPYSQFVEEDGLVYISGILPLHPPTASVLTGMPAGRQVEVCYENLKRTLEAGRGEIRNIGLLTVYVTYQAAAEVTEVVSRVFRSNSCLKVILPVSALPKGALVEIKAIGVLQTEALSKLANCKKPELEETAKHEGLDWEGITCSNFTFVVVQSRSSDLAVGEKIKILVEELINVISCAPDPLAIQWYGRAEAANNSVKQLQHVFPKTAVTTFSSYWMPADIKWICIISLCH